MISMFCGSIELLVWTDITLYRLTRVLTECCAFFFQMKGCIKVLKEQAPDSVEGLLNALR